jgi:hypothetical protein
MPTSLARDKSMLSMRALTLLLVLLFAGSAWAQSQVPPPTPSKASQDKKPHPDQSTQNTSAQDGNSNKAPFPVTLDNPVTIQKSDRDRNDDREEGERKASSDWGLVVATFALAGITLILAVITGVLAKYTFRLWGATDKLVKGAEDTAERQLRAYVMVLKAEIVNVGRRPYLPGVSEPWVDVTFKNFGQIPATKVIGKFAMCIKESPLTTDLDGRQTIVAMGLIAPGDTHTSRLNVAVNDRHTLTDSKNAFFVHGEVSYHDGFHPDRVTNFRYMRRGGEDLSRDSEMETYPEGNEIT